VTCRNERKFCETGLGGRDRLDFGTVRPRVQIPGPRPFRIQNPRFLGLLGVDGAQPGHRFAQSWLALLALTTSDTTGAECPCVRLPIQQRELASGVRGGDVFKHPPLSFLRLISDQELGVLEL
jgi:hypothetical protein